MNITELRLLDLMNANKNQAQGLLPPDVSQPGNIPGIDTDIQRQIGNIERQPQASLPPEMNTAEAQLRTMIGQMPKREDYKPTTRNKIAAAMIGLGVGYDPRYAALSDQVRNKGYFEAADEWDKKLKPLKELSDAEASRRTNERLIESSERTAGLTERRLGETERYNREKARIADARNEISAFKATNPGYKSVVAKDGKLVLWNPINGDTRETGIDTGKLDDATKLNMQIEGRLDEAAERGRQARMTAAVTGEQARLTGASNEAVKQPNRLEVIDRAADRRVSLEGVRQSHRTALLKMQQEGAITLRQTPTGNFMILAGTGGKGLLPTQEKVDRLNRMQQIISQYPELEEYYEINPDTHDVRVASPDSGFLGLGGDDEEERMRAYNLLFPPKAATAPKVPATTPQAVRPSATPVAGPALGSKNAEGKTLVERNGQRGYVTTPLPTDKVK